jgi:uncharacterized protein (DUF58 family)
MAGITELFSASDLSKTKNLEIIARQVVEGFCSGLHRSPHKGYSVEFRQHRAYVAGDEIRHIDWKVFGRSDRFYIREYEEETNLRATILLDRSGSMGYSSGGPSKLDYAVRLAACLGYLMLRCRLACNRLFEPNNILSFGDKEVLLLKEVVSSVYK